MCFEGAAFGKNKSAMHDKLLRRFGRLPRDCCSRRKETAVFFARSGVVEQDAHWQILK